MKSKIPRSLIRDVRKRKCIDPRRSDVGKENVVSKNCKAIFGGITCVRSQLDYSIKHIKNFVCSRRIHSNAMFNPEYIVGLIDGEGSFTVYVRNPDSHRKVKRRAKIEPKFYVKLVEKDKDILYEFKNFFWLRQRILSERQTKKSPELLSL